MRVPASFIAFFACYRRSNSWERRELKRGGRGRAAKERCSLPLLSLHPPPPPSFSIVTLRRSHHLKTWNRLQLPLLASSVGHNRGYTSPLEVIQPRLVTSTKHRRDPCSQVPNGHSELPEVCFDFPFILGPVVRRPISANPGLNFNPGPGCSKLG